MAGPLKLFRFIKETARSRRGVRMLVFALAAGAGDGALADPHAYAPVAAHLDRGPASDATLKAAVAALREAAEAGMLGKIIVALSPHFTVLACSSDPTTPCSRDAKEVGRSNLKLPPAERLRQGFCCGDVPKAEMTKAMRDETALGLLTAMLSEETIGADPQVQAMACLPAPVIFDHEKAKALAAAADVGPENLRVSAAEIIVQEKPESDAAEIGRIPAGQIVPLVTLGEETIAAGWNAVVMPDGRHGYSDRPVLNDLATSELCFAKDKKGAWSIIRAILRKDEGS